MSLGSIDEAKGRTCGFKEIVRIYAPATPQYPADTMTATADVSNFTTRVHRVEVRCTEDEYDPVAASLFEQAQLLGMGVAEIKTSRVYLIEAGLHDSEINQVARVLLADPINQHAVIGSADVIGDAPGVTIEVHYKPGVMDPVAQSTREAIVEMLPRLGGDGIEVRTGKRYDLIGCADVEAAQRLAQAISANPVIHDIHTEPFWPPRFPRGSAFELRIVTVPLRELDDDDLVRLSRAGHLFLSVEEMKAVQAYYRDAGREPTDIELETLAQTWSEHCVHKTLKSTIHYQSEIRNLKSEINWTGRPGHTVNPDGSVTIDNLLRSTIAAATHQLIDSAIASHSAFCVSVFEDNAGIVKFDDEDGIAVKVETHNHPSALEPYGGAATGIGGCIRDIMGTGKSARPIANTDIFCVADPGIGDRVIGIGNRCDPEPETRNPKSDCLPAGVLHPRRILQQVVAGVRDYGNRMGIPTVNGSVCFDDDYVGNPLIFVGCVGILPLEHAFGEPAPGDRIIVLGGRTGRDGIHGATFSSAELTDTHADEFSHAVQIGNAITQKKMMDVILQARDPRPPNSGGRDNTPTQPLFHAITDCGAGGFSSAVGEMGEKIGAIVTLETAPLKYDGLSYTEIWISEAQERMVLAVPPDSVETLHRLCQAEEVELCDLGRFGQTDESGDPLLVLTYSGAEVGRLPMGLLHDGIPTPTRQAQWGVGGMGGPRDRGEKGKQPDNLLQRSVVPSPRSLNEILLGLLSHPNIASKQWIVRQYDHEVQGGSVIKPLVGPQQDGPSDAAVVRPKFSSDRGVAIGCGLQPTIGEKASPQYAADGDSYWMALASIDEAVRNVVCVGADPTRIAILDNFCWPSCDDARHLGALVRAAEACYDGALAYRTPFISGKDSLNNQFATDDGPAITIPPTLLITAVGIVEDIARCVTMDAKSPGNVLLMVGQTTSAMGGSHYVRTTGDRSCDLQIPRVDLKAGPKCAAAVADLIVNGLVRSAHDCSEGGLLVAAAEMAFAGRVGLDISPDTGLSLEAWCFAETSSRYLLEIEPANLNRAQQLLDAGGAPYSIIGTFADHSRLTVVNLDGPPLIAAPLDDLRNAWLKPLDW